MAKVIFDDSSLASLKRAQIGSSSRCTWGSYSLPPGYYKHEVETFGGVGFIPGENIVDGGLNFIGEASLWVYDRAKCAL